MTAPKWLNDQTWGCPNHVPMPRLPTQCLKCWFCQRPRPFLPKLALVTKMKPLVPKMKPFVTPPSDTKKRASVPLDPSLLRPKCAWHDCASFAATASKYCSRKCSNKNAHARSKSSHPPAK